MPEHPDWVRLRNFAQSASAINVVLASEGTDAAFEFQRLNITEAVSEEFRELVLEALDFYNSDLDLRPFDPGYKPDSHEVMCLDLEREDRIASIIQSISALNSLQLFQEDDYFIQKLRFYAIVATTQSRKAVFFRTYSKSRELSRRPGFALIFRRGQYDKVETPIFTFDKKIDCVTWEDNLYILNVPHFERIFDYFSGVAAQAEAAIDEVMSRVPVSNADELKQLLRSQRTMATRIALVARRPYFSRVTMADIKRTIQEFGLDLEIVRENGTEKIVFENSPKKRWLIAKLLDDSYLGSIMTSEKYEVNSKTRVAR
jgi:hypothetical protein